MDIIPFLRLRVPNHVERLGIDKSEMAETAYDDVRSQLQPEARKMVYVLVSEDEQQRTEFNIAPL